MAQCIPEHPEFASEAEESVWRALKSKLRDVDVLMHGVRLSDGLYGDVEIDLLVLMPDCGAAVIEVKGGQVSHAGGRWTSSGAHGVVRIHPIEQARNGMHSLRRFVEQQPSWSRGPASGDVVRRLPVHGRRGRHGTRGTSRPHHRRGRRAQTPRDASTTTCSARPRRPRCRPGAGSRHSSTSSWARRARDAASPVGRRRRLRHVESLTARAVRPALGRPQQPPARDHRLGRHRQDVAGHGAGPAMGRRRAARRLRHLRTRVRADGQERPRRRRRQVAARPSSEPSSSSAFAWGVEPPADPDDDLSTWDGAAQMEWAGSHAERLRALRRLRGRSGRRTSATPGGRRLLSAARNRSTLRLAVFRDDQHSVFPGRAGRPDLPMVQLSLDKNLRNSRPIVDTIRPLLHSPVDPIGGRGLPRRVRERPRRRRRHLRGRQRRRHDDARRPRLAARAGRPPDDAAPPSRALRTGRGPRPATGICCGAPTTCSTRR